MKDFNSKFKKFSAVLCGVGIMCSGFALAGCGESDKHAGKIEVIGTETTYVDTWADAVKALNDGVTLKLHKNVVLGETFDVPYTITIDGMGKYSITADKTVGEDFAQLIRINTKERKILTLKDVKVDANKKGRAVLVDKNNGLVVDGATITGGYMEDSYATGVYVTSAGTFKMTSGQITGNEIGGTKYADKYYAVYSQDLWVGANASGELNSTITGGKIGYMFVNANSYSGTNPGKFVMENGHIENVWVEYGNGYGATFEYKAGQIDTLRVSKTTEGEFETVTPVAGTTYLGGTSYKA